MASVGEKLRRERLHRGWELARVSRELKISARMLEAIEEEKFERLPGGVFTKSFVRQYARLLGFDEEEIVAEVQRLNESTFAIETLLDAEPDPNQMPLIQVPRMEMGKGLTEKRFSWFSWMPAAALVILVMLVCSAIYSRWQRSHDLAAAGRYMEADREAPPPPVAKQPFPPVPEIVPGGAMSTESVGPSSVPHANAPADEAARPPNAAVRVELTAKEKVWISARADGKILFSGMLTENETRTVEANDKLLLRVGNAGAIDVTLNGKALGVLGARGQPRTVQFTSGGFQTVAASMPVLSL